MDSRLVLNMGDLVFVRGDGWVSRAIEDITHSSYSHVALAVSGDTLIECQAGEPVCYVPASKYANEADVYRSALDAVTLTAAVNAACAHIGERYGYGLIAEEFVREETGIQLPWHARGPICSVLISDAVRKAGVGFCQGIQYPAPADEARDGLYVYAFSY